MIKTVNECEFTQMIISVQDRISIRDTYSFELPIELGSCKYNPD